MCRYCVLHGSGRRWFLNAENYASKHFGDEERRELAKIYLKNEKQTPFALKYSIAFRLYPQLLEMNIPFFSQYLRVKAKHLLEHYHFGQVLSPEEALDAVEVAGHTALIDCWCRARQSRHRELYCLGVGAFSDFAESLNFKSRDLSIEETRKFLQEMHSKHCYHSIWTLKTPFLYTICSCDARYCWGYRGRFRCGVEQALIKGHCYSTTDSKKCSGCGACVYSCLFQARALIEGIAMADDEKCMGCGLCKAKCEQNAIKLREHEE